MVNIFPLDFQSIFINSLAGSVPIFVFMAGMVIGALGAMFQLPNLVYFVMLALFGVLFWDFLGGLQVIFVVVVGIIVFYTVAKIMR